MAVSVDLPACLEREIDDGVGKGRYKSKSELIRGAVRGLLEEREKIEYKRISTEDQERI